MLSFQLDKKQQSITICSDSLSLIREHFSIANPLYGRSKFANSFTPRRLYAITQTGKFDIGLYNEIISFCQKENIPFTPLTDTAAVKPLLSADLAALNLPLRDYQKESCQVALDCGRGVIVLPTGAGKTLTIATLYKSIQNNYKDYNFLIIVPTLQLIEQTYKDFLEYGLNSSCISRWSGDLRPDFNCSIIIAGLQVLLSQYTQHTEYLNSLNVVIIDECHKLRKQNEINKIFKYINTPIRFGFTGTLPPCKLDQWNICGKIGPVLYEKQSIDLRQNKQIANILIQILNFNYLNKPSLPSPDPNSPTKAFDSEIDFLINSKERNNKLAQLCANTDKNTLVIVERISHGETLYKAAIEKCSNKKIFFIQGSLELAAREEIRKLMEEQHNVVCIAISKIFAEGINIKNLHYIVFAAAGKAKIKILQTIGRGVRLHPLKNMLYILDIADNLRYGNKHLKERIKLYETEKIPYKATEIQI